MKKAPPAAGEGTESLPALGVAPSPHIANTQFTTRRMMIDVGLALLPLVGVSIVLYRQYALLQMLLGVAACIGAEALFSRMRGRSAPLRDGSAIITGLILGLSLPAGAPWYVAVIGGLAAIGFGKAVFGGLGQNIFNPAMVGRAFVMIAFPAALGATAYHAPAGMGIDALTQATPLTARTMDGTAGALVPMFLGWTSGSIGETSALAALVGGIFLCLRRTASWQIPVGLLGAVAVLGALFTTGNGWTAAHELSAGAVMFGAFFIATDPVSSPLTPKGKWIFGVGTGVLVMMIRTLSGYPEGVMFSVLIMNAFTPLINRATIPTPIGGPVPAR